MAETVQFECPACGEIIAFDSKQCNANTKLTAMHLLINLTVQIMLMLTARAAGLFYKHYNCYFGL
jgi:hypothetical protein